jgi:hypothetical protein
MGCGAGGGGAKKTLNYLENENSAETAWSYAYCSGLL